MDQQTDSQSVNQLAPVPTKKSKAWVLPTVLAVVFAAMAGFLGWKYMQLNTDNKDLKASVSDLTKQVADLKTSSSSAAAATSTSSSASSSSTTVVTLTDKQKETIVASLNTMNTQPLEGYMADEVSVVIAASEGQGVKSPADAVASLKYFSTATTPWDFNLGASVLSSYGKGFYAQYFGENTYVGKAVSKQVVSFHTNKSGKIDVIFIAADEMLLTE